ncbi:MAG TPA: class I SAM-dependent methyltransferase [Firmicutes bacterium]|nr:class I SAM-dependent methyltransferase [Bacillota bacterium]
MTSYSKLAQLYDDLMAVVDYQSWADYLHALVERFGAPGNCLLDLGCGTGTLTIALQQKGYEPVGVDLSTEMLAIAANKGLAVGLGIDNWLAMDMRSLHLPPDTFDIAICACDGFNYLRSDQELEAVFEQLKRILRPSGLLLFDVHTEYKMRHVLTSGPFVQEAEAGYCIWSSEYDETTGDAVHEMTLFVHEKGDLWRRYEEFHHQHYFSPDMVEKALAGNGFSLQAVLPWGSLAGEPVATTERLQYVARRKGNG